MSGDPDNLMLVYLRRIDARVENLRLDMLEVKQRMTSLEIQLGGLVASEQSHYGQTMLRLDRFADRLERIERRYDLSEADDGGVTAALIDDINKRG